MILVVGVLVVACVLVALTPARRSRAARLLRPAPRVPTPAIVVADSADLLALALTSGCGVVEAMGAVSEVAGGRPGRDLAMVVAAHSWGLTTRQAWALVDPAWQPVARALILADAAGVPPSATLAAAAQDIRTAELHRLEAAVERLSVRLVLPLGLAFLPAFVLTTVVPVVVALAGDLLTG